MQFTPFARSLLEGYYLRPDETPEQGMLRACHAWSAGDEVLEARLFRAVKAGWFMFASPVLSNAPRDDEPAKAMPISCFLTYVPDTRKGLVEHTTETRWLSMLGGGVGGHWSAVRSVDKKSPGPIPFLHTMDADTTAYHQGGTRKGSYAAYMNISHPDVREFLGLRTPTGDVHRKAMNLHLALNIPDAFMQAVLDGHTWNLVDPNDGTVRDTVDARLLWQEVLETRFRTGEPYLCFIDHANAALHPAQAKLGLQIHGSNLCSEIMLPTAEDRTAVCCLSSLNLEYFDEWKDTTLVDDLVTMLDNVLEYFIQHAPPELAKAVASAKAERSLGLGTMGWHSFLQRKNIPFESEEAAELNRHVFAHIKDIAKRTTRRLARRRGEPSDLKGTGERNAYLIALAPNANSAIILGVSPSIEPFRANAYTHHTRVGAHLVRNPYLVRVLDRHGQNNETVWSSIQVSDGSVQHLEFLTEREKAVFRTAVEIDQEWVIRHAADRQPYVDQGQSVNLFFPAGVQRSKVNQLHIEAWKRGMKALYYLRTESVAKADKVGVTLVRDALRSVEDAPACVACEA